MEKVRPWCGQPSDRGRLRNRNIEFKWDRDPDLFRWNNVASPSLGPALSSPFRLLYRLASLLFFNLEQPLTGPDVSDPSVSSARSRLSEEFIFLHKLKINRSKTSLVRQQSLRQQQQLLIYTHIEFINKISSVNQITAVLQCLLNEIPCTQADHNPS